MSSQYLNRLCCLTCSYQGQICFFQGKKNHLVLVNFLQCMLNLSSLCLWGVLSLPLSETKLQSEKPGKLPLKLKQSQHFHYGLTQKSIITSSTSCVVMKARETFTPGATLCSSPAAFMKFYDAKWKPFCAKSSRPHS